MLIFQDGHAIPHLEFEIFGKPLTISLKLANGKCNCHIKIGHTSHASTILKLLNFLAIL